jgi:RHS repeat-associated protein
LDFFATETGRVKVQSGGTLRHEYNLTDHLGNTRVMFADTNNNGTPELVEESHYYAFGMRIEGLSTTNPDNKFTYNGKELEDDHGLNWYHYGARFYDAQIGRWHVVDLVDEFHSPYLFVGNNPVRFVDPDGSETQDYQKLWNQLTSAEKEFVTNNPLVAWDFYDARNEAFTMAAQTKLEGAHGGYQDAFRHAYWNALMAKAHGKEKALEYSNAHEARDNPVEIVVGDMLMDKINNSVGAEIGAANSNLSNQEIANLVMDALNSGKLKILNEDLKVISSDTQMTQDQFDRISQAILDQAQFQADRAKAAQVPPATPQQPKQ